MGESGGLLSGFVLDGRGGGRPLEWEGVEAWRPSDGVLWVHLDRTGERARRWVRDLSGIDEVTATTLLGTEGNRPRVQRIGDGLLVSLRGVNFTPGQSRDDMPSVHVWIERERIVSLRRRRLLAGQEIADDVRAGRGPVDSGDWLVRLVRELDEPLGPAVVEVEEAIDALAERALEDYGPELRRLLRGARQEAINFRRHLAPQRDALARLPHETVPWLGDLARAYLRELGDRVARYVEDLDAARERALVAQDELNNQLAERMNKTVYLLTVLSALLLPPSLITGLFGVNVGGMPLVESKLGFAVIAVSLPVIAALELWLLRRLRWI